MEYLFGGLYSSAKQIDFSIIFCYNITYKYANYHCVAGE